MMTDKTNEYFWNADIRELKNGYIENEDLLECLVCGNQFTKGRIYQIKEIYYDARKTMSLHIEKEHDSMLQYFLQMNVSFLGISESQQNIVRQFASGKTDKQIGEEFGIATSTIRNHRFKLREKEKQAKLFLAMMELLGESSNKKINTLEEGIILDSHKTAKMVDDRFNTTDKEKIKVIDTYFGENDRLITYPSKAKKKIIVLEKISTKFSKKKIYTEAEVNEVLRNIYDDFASIRRALIEYGFLDRSKDCKEYWIKK